MFEKGASSRRVYLPRGAWYDFWTEQRVAGGREVVRPVDLATMPLYVRAGAVVPIGPIRQYTEENVAAPVTLVVYPGATATSMLYDDDGVSFDHRNGDYARLLLEWNDANHRLTLRLAPDSRLLAMSPRRFQVREAGSTAARAVSFSGEPLVVQL